MGFLILVFVILFFFLFRQMTLFNNRVEHIEKYLQELTQEKKEKEAGKIPAQVVETVVPIPQTLEVPRPGAEVVVPYAVFTDMLKQDSDSKATVSEDMVAKAVIMPETKSVSDSEVLVHEVDLLTRAVQWLKTDWLMKIGGFLVILGVGWFVSYAFENDWVSYSQRILLGFFLGVGVMALAWNRSKEYLSQGAVLLFVGASISVLTLYADQMFYKTVPSVVSLVLMFLIACALGAIAVFRRHEPLAYADVLLATVAPMLVATDFTFGELNMYYLAMTLGAIWVSALTGWRSITLLSFAIVFCMGLPYLGYEGIEADTGLLFSFIFTTLFFVISILAMRIAKKASLVDVSVALGFGLYLLLWILNTGSPEKQSLLLVLWALLFIAGARLSVKLGTSVGFLYTYAGVAATYIGVATAITYDGPSLAIAFIFETTLLFILGYHLTKNEAVLLPLAFPLVIPLSIATKSIFSPLWETGVLHEDAVVLSLLLLALVTLSVYVRHQIAYSFEKSTEVLRILERVFMALVGLYSAILVWLCTFALIADDSWALLAWALFFVWSVSLASQFAFGKEFFYSYALFSLLFLVSTPGADVTFEMYTIVFTIITTGLLFVGHHVSKSDTTLLLLSAPCVIPVFRSIHSIIAPEWNTGVFHVHAVVVGLILLSFVTISVYIQHQKALLADTVYSVLYALEKIWISGVGFYSVVLTWLVVFALVPKDTVALYVWTVIFVVSISVASLFSYSKKLFASYTVVSLLALTTLPGVVVFSTTHNIVFIIVTTAVLFIGYASTRLSSALPILSLPLLIPLCMSLESLFAPEWSTGIVHEHARVVFLMLTALVCVALFYTDRAQRARENKNEGLLELMMTAWTIVGIYSARCVWLVVHGLISNTDVATMITLFIYTTIGSALYISAKRTDIYWQKIAGLLLLGFVIVRLLFVEVKNMELIGRMITFVVIGVVLIAVAWYISNERRRKSGDSARTVNDASQANETFEK